MGACFSERKHKNEIKERNRRIKELFPGIQILSLKEMPVYETKKVNIEQLFGPLQKEEKKKRRKLAHWEHNQDYLYGTSADRKSIVAIFFLLNKTKATFRAKYCTPDIIKGELGNCQNLYDRLLEDESNAIKFEDVSSSSIPIETRSHYISFKRELKNAVIDDKCVSSDFLKKLKKTTAFLKIFNELKKKALNEDHYDSDSREQIVQTEAQNADPEALWKLFKKKNKQNMK